MKRYLVLSFMILSVLSGLSVISAAEPDRGYVEDELIIQFDEVSKLQSRIPIPDLMDTITGCYSIGNTGITGPVSVRSLKETVTDSVIPGSVIKRDLEHVESGLVSIKLGAGFSVEEAMYAAMVSGEVASVQPNFIYRMAFIPNDPFFDNQWGLHNTGQSGGFVDADIDAPEAWDIYTGGKKESDDPNVVVAVIDTGIDYLHPDLFLNMWINEGELFADDPNAFDIEDYDTWADPNEVDDDGNSYVDDLFGFDFAGDDPEAGPDPDPMDFYAHGTHVAGIIGAIGNNEIGITGVNWDVKLMALKVSYNNGTFATSDVVIEAIDYATDRRVDVINASWGGYYYDPALRGSIVRAGSAGILFVAAAGNAMNDNDGLFSLYPASYSLANIISVMATDHYDRPASYSNYGSTSVDLAAPGGDIIFSDAEGILSTTPTEQSDFMDANDISTYYDYFQGTSIAAPFVTGAVSLMKAYDNEDKLSAIDIKNSILFSVDRLDSLEGLCVSEGRLNLYEAMKVLKFVYEENTVYNATLAKTYNFITDAVDAANDGDEIIIQAGETFIEEVDFGTKNLSLRSGDMFGAGHSKNDPGPIEPETTIITSVLDFSDYVNHTDNNTAVLRYAGGQDTNSVINGIQIAGGIPYVSVVTQGIECINGSTPRILNCYVRNHSATGILLEDDSDVYLYKCLIYSNEGSSGAGIYADNDSDVLIESSSIYDNNSLSGPGGGICADGDSDIIMEGSKIYGNTSVGDGGGIYGNLGSSVTLRYFTDPSLLPGNPNVPTLIYENSSGGNGGGIYVRLESDLTCIEETEIYSNTSVGNGAGIYAENTNNFVIEDSTIAMNTTGSDKVWRFGGGIYLFNCIADINNTEISFNTVGGYAYGGGLYCDSTELTMTGCKVTSNRANWEGGGLSIEYDSTADINNTTFSLNSAQDFGGGMGGYQSESTFRNCLFTMNFIDSWNGGSIHLTQADAEVVNCTFANNSASIVNPAGLGAGVLCYDDSHADVTNSIFSENADGAVIVFLADDSDSSSATLEYNLFFENDVADYGIYNSDEDWHSYFTGKDDLDVGTGNMTNVEGNPLFVTGELGDFYLSSFEAGQITNGEGRYVGEEYDDPDNYGQTIIPQPAEVNSPAIDAGSGLASDLGFDNLSTRTDKVNDSDTIDIGYHYKDSTGLELYTLNAYVGSGEGSIEPSVAQQYKKFSEVLLVAEPDEDYQFQRWEGTDDDARIDTEPFGDEILRVQYNRVTMTGSKVVQAHFETILITLITRIVALSEDGTIIPDTPSRGIELDRGVVVKLEADPVNPAHVIIWSGTDDDYSTSRDNTITMLNDPEVVEVQFYDPQVLHVGDYMSLREALAIAQDRDIIKLDPSGKENPYLTSYGYDINGQAITIQSSNPEDPCCVADTVIEMDSGDHESNAFTFLNVGRNTVLNGITIRNFNIRGLDGLDGSDIPDGWPTDGLPGVSVIGAGILCGGTDFLGGLFPASPTIKNCVIRNCSGEGGDGGVGEDGDIAWYTQAGHGGWPGKAYGGGLACLYGSNPLVENVRFINCNVYGGNGGAGGNFDVGYGGRGGGWYYFVPPFKPYDWPGTNLGWESFTLDMYNMGPSYLYTGKGGAAYVGVGCSPEFIDCEFVDCSSLGGFNGIEGVSFDDVIYEPTLNWKIETYGGAVFVDEGSNASFVDCNYVNNIADANRGYKGIVIPEGQIIAGPAEDIYTSAGGAVATWLGANPYFERCNFRGNSGLVGGAFYAEDTTAKLSDCNFYDNDAFHGGGLYFVGGNPQIARSSFTGNSANWTFGRGGGISAVGTNTSITDSTFERNYAGGSGGGIYVSNKDFTTGEILDGDKTQIKNGLFAGNTAGNDGGAISTDSYAEPNLINVTMADNRVIGRDGYGGGLSVSMGGNTKLFDSILWNNTAPNGGQVSVGYDGSTFYSALQADHTDIGQELDVPIAPYLDTSVSAVRPTSIFDNRLAIGDDLSSPVGIGFNLNFFGTTYTQIYVNNNGSVTFAKGMPEFDFMALVKNIGTPIIAPFMSDVDTLDITGTFGDDVLARVGDFVAFGPNTIDLRKAYFVTWSEVGYYNAKIDKLNTFQLVLIDRSDTGKGNFDIELNYDQILWESGDASFGNNGFGGQVGRCGFSAGTGAIGTYYELPGSGVPGDLIDGSDKGLIHHGRDTDVAGRYVFEVRNGIPEIPAEADEPLFVGERSKFLGYIYNEVNERWDPNAGAGNFVSDPLFVEGIKGDYHLSQISSGQSQESSAVDAGSRNAYLRDMYRHTTRTDWKIDGFVTGYIDVNQSTDQLDTVDLGWHYLLSNSMQGDWDYDGDVDLGDYDSFRLDWLDTGCIFPNYCHERDLNQDGVVNNFDYAIWSGLIGENEQEPPEPDPMKWAVRPNSSGSSSVTMTAKTAVDEYCGSDVEYQFEYYPSHDIARDWNWNPAFNDTGLMTGQEYAYRVRARDCYDNRTEWSLSSVGIPGLDTSAPNPDPMTWSLVPYATAYNSIEMVATTAVDDVGSVQYLFDCLTLGGNDSDWQSSQVYTDTGLFADTTYEYRVKARDSALNETLWSEVKSATTFPQPPADPNILYDPLLVIGMGTGSGILYEPAMELYSHVIVSEFTPDPLGRPIYVRFVCLDEDGFSSPWVNTAGPLPLIIDNPQTSWIDQQFQYAGNMVSYQVVVSWGHALYYNWRVELSYSADGSGEVSYDEVFLAPQF